MLVTVLISHTLGNKKRMLTARVPVSDRLQEAPTLFKRKIVAFSLGFIKKIDAFKTIITISKLI